MVGKKNIIATGVFLKMASLSLSLSLSLSRFISSLHDFCGVQELLKKKQNLW
jgi:hypothetical protein